MGISFLFFFLGNISFLSARRSEQQKSWTSSPYALRRAFGLVYCGLAGSAGYGMENRLYDEHT